MSELSDMMNEEYIFNISQWSVFREIVRIKQCRIISG